jgi:hypothetical protein
MLLYSVDTMKYSFDNRRFMWVYLKYSYFFVGRKKALFQAQKKSTPFGVAVSLQVAGSCCCNRASL